MTATVTVLDERDGVAYHWRVKGVPGTRRRGDRPGGVETTQGALVVVAASGSLVCSFCYPCPCPHTEAVEQARSGGGDECVRRD